MDLIIKPTEKCNFKCTFCSSTMIADQKTDELELERIRRFVQRFPDTNTIIVNGGDPLMMSPDYYWKMIEILDEEESHASISMTTNLWPFLVKPKKWAPLFNHERVGINTSFQYGGGRLKGDFTEFTEEDFWRCSDAMLEYVGYRPDFIAVITEENEHDAIRNVELAYKMSEGQEPVGGLEGMRDEKTGVECKLNYAMASGDQDAPYVKSKIYEKYVEIHKLGLMPWEFNTKQMAKRLRTQTTTCPQNRTCDSGIRTLQPSGDYYSCGAFGDDREKPINFELEMNGKFFTPLRKSPELHSLKQSCYSCPMFDICNGCYKTVKDLKQHNLVEDHCKRMKGIAQDIIDINGVDRQTTPYIDESNNE